MARRVIGLDLGAYSVKLVRLESGKQGTRFEIIDTAEEILSHDEEVQRDLLEKQKQAILNLYQRGILEAETFAIGLEAESGQMRTMKVPFADARKIEAVLPGLLEAEVPYEIDDMIVSWHPMGKTQAEGENVDGASIRIAFGRKSAIAGTLQMLQSFSLDPRQMHLSSAAPYELVREFGFDIFSNHAPIDSEINTLCAIIDFGHRATSLSIFDRTGLKISRSFLRGGKHLTEEIAQAFEIPFKDAEILKHEKLNFAVFSDEEQIRITNQLGLKHYEDLIDEITRVFISVKTSGLGEVRSVAYIGGASNVNGFLHYFQNALNDLTIAVVPPPAFLPQPASKPAFATALAYALSGLEVHTKDNRFNFRKDEFAWRGELDFLRSKSVPLILWGLILICSLTVLWSANALVLQKENDYVENRLKTACNQILQQKNIPPKKCLAMMNEQISAQVDVGIPAFGASDVYLEMAKFLPKELKVTITELDVSEKKVRISGETGNFEDIDKVVLGLGKIPCFINIERGRAQQTDKLVKFSLTSDLECNAALAKPKNQS